MMTETNSPSGRVQVASSSVLLRKGRAPHAVRCHQRAASHTLALDAGQSYGLSIESQFGMSVAELGSAIWRAWQDTSMSEEVGDLVAHCCLAGGELTMIAIATIVAANGSARVAEVYREMERWLECDDMHRKAAAMLLPQFSEGDIIDTVERFSLDPTPARLAALDAIDHHWPPRSRYPASAAA